MDNVSREEWVLSAPLSIPSENGKQFSELMRDSLLTSTKNGTRSGKARLRGRAGFSLLEILVVLLIMGIISAIALPSALNSLKGYRLHADATAIASYLNVVRMKSASQYAPYRLVVNPTLARPTYVMERLCGNTPSAAPGDPNMNPQFDANCTGANSAYQPFTTPQLEGGTQYISQANSFFTCLPANVTAGVYPGTIVANLAACPTTTNPFYIYFNTRGSPVDNTGSPLVNGGAVLYIQGQNKLDDAVTVSIGGRVATYMWGGTAWGLR